MVLESNYSLENFDPEVLREYDIRGIVGSNLNENTAYTIGRTFGFVVKSRSSSSTVVTGFDGRITSPKLHHALCEGLKQAGAKVINVGMGPTPMIYFAHHHFNSDAAVMVTGSHNPPDYNGFKMVFNKNSFYADEIQNLQSIMQNEKLNIEEGSFIQHNITNEYVKRDLQNININNKLKIAWDTGNGAMGLIIKEITSQLQNTKNILINENVDGTFPNHHPDPQSRNSAWHRAA